METLFVKNYCTCKLHLSKKVDSMYCFPSVTAILGNSAQFDSAPIISNCEQTLTAIAITLLCLIQFEVIQEIVLYYYPTFLKAK